MPTRRTTILTRRYDVKERVLALKLILSLVRCFDRIPLAVNIIGVTMPKITGTHVGACLTTAVLIDTAGEDWIMPERLMMTEHARMAKRP